MFKCTKKKKTNVFRLQIKSCIEIEKSMVKDGTGRFVLQYVFESILIAVNGHVGKFAIN